MSNENAGCQLGLEGSTYSFHGGATSNQSRWVTTKRLQLPHQEVLGIWKYDEEEVPAKLLLNEPLSHKFGDDCLLALPRDIT